MNDSRKTAMILLAGDMAALALFVLVGQREHETLNAANPPLGMLPNVIALAIPWMIAAWLLGALRVGNDRPQFFARTLNAWLVAALFGLLLRSFLFGRAIIPAVFIVATLGFGGLFLFAWRTVFLVARRFAGNPK
jgi:hypothetical protein